MLMLLLLMEVQPGGAESQHQQKRTGCTCNGEPHSWYPSSIGVVSSTGVSALVASLEPWRKELSTSFSCWQTSLTLQARLGIRYRPCVVVPATRV